MAASDRNVISTNDFQIIWLDNHFLDVTQPDYLDRRIDLGRFIQHLTAFVEPNRCHEHIASLDNADKVFLIVSGSVGEEMLLLIHDLVQIICVYVFCADIQKHQEWAKKFGKIRGVFNDSQFMLDRLQRDVQLLLHHLAPVSIFTMQNVKETSLQNIDKEQATYMWFQLLMDVLLRLPRTAQARRELIDECTERYRNDEVEKRKIRQFDNEYTCENVIEWYTRDCFLYRLVNRAFRTRNIDTIFKYRYFMVDLHERLLKLHRQQQSTYPLAERTVYRGQLIAAEELTKLKANIGGIFSVNTFLSTTFNSNVALKFITDAFGRPFFEKILYEIKLTGQGPWKWPFADVHNTSYNADESELLFDFGSTFRIDDVYEYTQDLWCVDLTLLDIHNSSCGIDTKLYDYLVQKRIGKDEPTLLLLCNFLEEMGENERSRQFCQMMLRDMPKGQQLIDIHVHLALLEYNLSNFHEAKAICEKTLNMQSEFDKKNGGTKASSALSLIHSHLGHVLSELGLFKTAIHHYHQAILLDALLLPEDDVDLAVGFNNLGIAYQDLGDIKKALYWLEKRALKLQLLKLPSNHPDLATTYSNIGETYSENGNYVKARENYERVLGIEKNSLPPLHPSTKMTFGNLGVVCEKTGDYDAALAYHRQALEVLLHSYVLHHILFATTYNNMAAVFDWQGNFNEALCYYNKALECLLINVGSENHPDIASIYNNIGMVYFEKKDYKKALEHFEKTRKIEERMLEPNHCSLATTYNNLGMVYEVRGLLKQAMQYHQLALTIRHRILSKTHPELATTYTNIGVVHHKQGHYKIAIDFHQRALSIQKTSLPRNHPSTATTNEHLGDVYLSLGNHRAALKYYTGAVSMARGCLSDSHPLVKQCADKLNQVQTTLAKK